MTDVKIPEKLLFFLNKKARYKITYGGRGSGKSWTAARCLIVLAMSSKIRVLCTRQLQTSIANSVHKLLSDSIQDLGLSKYFEITRDAIRCNNGSEFFFKGIQNNINEIKSIEGIDYCWVEEAQSVSENSWEVLIPTIRKENSEIWVTFNPDREEDATFQRFVKNPPPDCITALVNFYDNPWFPDVLQKEMEYCKEVDYGKYEHIWLGKTVIDTDAQIYHGKFELKEFETPEDAVFYYGADWGFACLVGDTLVKTDKGDIQIKDIKIGDKVLTREGYKKVLFTQQKGFKEVYELDCGYGSTIIATGDHRIYTKEGWKQVKDLKDNEEICVIQSNLMARFIKDIQKVSTLITTIGNTEGNANTQYFIEQFGNTIMEKFLMIVIFIILTAIRSITILPIFYALLKANIKKSITKINLAPFPKTLQGKTDIQKRIGQKEEKRHFLRHKLGEEYAKSADNLLKLLTYIKNIVVQSVENEQTQEKIKKNIFVKFAAKHLLPHLTATEKPVLKSAHINLRLLKEPQEVFDITVENGEYFANGMLVHNCDPTAVVRCFIKDQCLYIDYESGGVGVEFEELPALFNKIPGINKWEIRCDSARPETISYMSRHGFRTVACPKWKGSVEDGIEYIRSFRRIYIHPRCKHTYEEFKFYSYKQDKNTGDILPVALDKDNHYCDALRYALNPYIQKNISILSVL